jgi:hypothetical protein
MEAKNRSTHPEFAAVRYFAGKVMASVLPILVVALAAIITAVWIGVLGFGVVRLVEYAMVVL